MTCYRRRQRGAGHSSRNGSVLVVRESDLSTNRSTPSFTQTGRQRRTSQQFSMLSSRRRSKPQSSKRKTPLSSNRSASRPEKLSNALMRSWERSHSGSTVPTSSNKANSEIRANQLNISAEGFSSLLDQISIWSTRRNTDGTTVQGQPRCHQTGLRLA